MMILVTGGASSGKSAYAEGLACALPGRRYYLAAMKPFGEEGARRIERHRAMRAGKGFTTVECFEGLAKVGGVGGAQVPPASGEEAPSSRPGCSHVQNDAPLQLSCDEVRDEAADNSIMRGDRGEYRVASGGAGQVGLGNDGLVTQTTALLESLGNVVANELFRDDGTSVSADCALSAVLAGVDHAAALFGNLVIVGDEVGGDGLRYDGDTDTYIRVIGSASCAIAARCDIVVECVAGMPYVIKGADVLSCLEGAA